MAWLTGNTSERVDQAVYNFRVQYGNVGRLIDEGFSAADFYNHSYSDDTEVVRRIRQNVVTYVWPGLEKTTAQAKLSVLRMDSSYKNPTAKWNGAGGYDVTATQVKVDPAGWSLWYSIKDSESAW